MSMRYVAGTFDAPFPASAGVRALALAGVPGSDVRVIPSATVDRADHPGLGPAHYASEVSGPSVADALRAARDLVAAEDAASLARVLQPGQVLVFARVPTVRASSAAAALRAVGARGVTESTPPAQR